MNDPLREAIDKGLDEYEDEAANATDALVYDRRFYVDRAVRAWLSLPPSEEEIEAVAKVMGDYDAKPHGDSWEDLGAATREMYRREVTRTLVASRAVLVRPPEGAS